MLLSALDWEHKRAGAIALAELRTPTTLIIEMLAT
jgi:hypothetical protein